jgi:hypothetical protein
MSWSLRTAKRPEREAHHTPPSSTEIMNMGNYTSTSPYAFVACTGSNNFTFTIFCKNFNIVWLYNMLLRCGRLAVNKCQVSHGIILCWLLFSEFILPGLKNKGFPAFRLSVCFVGKAHFLLTVSLSGNSCRNVAATVCGRVAQSGECCDRAVMDHWRKHRVSSCLRLVCFVHSRLVALEMKSEDGRLHRVQWCSMYSAWISKWYSGHMVHVVVFIPLLNAETNEECFMRNYQQTLRSYRLETNWVVVRFKTCYNRMLPMWHWGLPCPVVTRLRVGILFGLRGICVLFCVVISSSSSCNDPISHTGKWIRPYDETVPYLG